MNGKKLIITPPLRLHLNLHAMNNDTFRKNGGIGIAIQYPNTDIEFTRSTSFSFDNCNVDNDILERLVDLLSNIKSDYNFEFGFKASIGKGLESHIGLGTGTAITLAAIEALFLINDTKATENTIKRLSRRGGTSGVGIHSYFTGGVIFDSGIKKDNLIHIPSSYVDSPVIPTQVLRLDFPDWDIYLCFPTIKTATISGIKEKEFFDKTTPLENHQAYKSTHISFMGIAPSIIEDDYFSFCLAIKEIQKTIWKKSEIDISKLEYIDFHNWVDSIKFDAYGQTSFGPTLYAFTKNPNNLPLNSGKDLAKIKVIKANNSGRRVRYE